jgi:serine/threonine protein phosphatase 1
MNVQEELQREAMMTDTRVQDPERTDLPVDYPPAPDNQIIYVIGDIHGRLDLLEQVHKLIDRDKARMPWWQGARRHAAQNSPASPATRESANARDGRPSRNGILRQPFDPLSELPSDCLLPRLEPAVLEIYLGDYIDRGDDSRAVVELLIERAQKTKTVFLRGNHEQFLLEFMAGTLDFSIWKQVGALPTLRSYGIQVGQFGFSPSQNALRSALEKALAPKHGRFYSDTVPYHVAGPYLFVHAGVRPGISLEQQHPEDLMGIRRPFLEFEGNLGHVVVHGHTPAREPEFKRNRINVDTGAYSTGRLTCLRIGPDGPRVL